MKNTKLVLIDSLEAQVVSLRESIRPILKQIQSVEDKIEKTSEVLEQQLRRTPQNKKTIELFEANNVEDIFIGIRNDDSEFRVFEDDGTLHVTIGQVHGCFICNQELRKSEWNAEARKVLKGLGIPFSKLDK